jgi:predicted MFS family arabinose efflux permease
MDATVSIPEKKFTAYQVLAIILLALTQFTVVLDFMVMSPLGDMLIKSMGLTTSQFGFAVSAYAFSAGISGLLTAGFADRFDRKKLLLFFYIGFIAGTLFCGLSHTYYMLLAARIITGVFGGVIGSISMAIMADLFPLHQRGRAMGFMQMGFGASQVLGIPISLYIANHWGWQSPFIMIVGLSGLIWLITLLKLNPVTKHLHLKNDKTAVLHLWHTLKLSHYRTGFLMTALLSLGGFMMMPWGSAFAVNNLQVSYGQLPILFMTSGIAALIIMPLVGKLSDKINKVKLFTIAAIWMMVIIVIYTNLKPIPFPLIMMMNILMMIGIMSRIVPAMALVTALPKMQDRGAFMSINSSLQQIAGGIAAGVGGLIVVQKTKTSPLQHYDTLGYLIVVIIIANIIQVHRVNNLIKAQKHTDKL